MPRIDIFSLSCPNPDCGQELIGLPYDKVFFCRHCLAGARVRDGKMRSEPVIFARPNRKEAGSLLHLPFWRVEGTIRAENPTKPQQAALDRLREISPIWVPAFLTLRKEVYGDPGERLTLRRSALLPEALPSSARPVLVGASRDVGEAVRYAALFVIDLVDKRTDVTGMNIHIDAPRTSLWGLPFIDGGETLVALYDKETIASRSIADLPDIRKAIAAASNGV